MGTVLFALSIHELIDIRRFIFSGKFTEMEHPTIEYLKSTGFELILCEITSNTCRLTLGG
jgi:hypothetical protein